ncbi:MAG TPA: anti-sigma factor [Actinomycetota bacterium]|nr:anti-sigma factor [Actinomycetota bacterium]
MGCEQVTELAPELALGVADGHERESALDHMSGCQTCRRLVWELSALTDDLLLLAPEHEAPPGLEDRVLDAISFDAPERTSAPRALPTPRRRPLLRRAWRVALVAAGLTLALAVGATGVFLGTADDRRVAEAYRALLGVGQGSFFAAAPVWSDAREVGTAWGYQGHPSWVFVSLRTPEGDRGWYRAWLLTSDGRRISLGRTELGGGAAAWGHNLPVDLSTARALILEPEGAGDDLVATFAPDSPWEGAGPGQSETAGTIAPAAPPRPT